ncbi:MAG: type II toxin-antitoxin system VapC family toxin [Candidatus Tectomicrobia bacterium]|nr:type II toxin-antitoxin system VapC family toxin [Candidatus Tectomicrobia bacterium]
MAEFTLFDTDVLIDALRDVSEAASYLEEEEQRSVLSISIVTQMELVVGCRNNDELRKLEQFLERFVVVSLSQAIGEQSLALLRQYRLSHGLLIPDALIAATAITLQRSLVAKNQRDYRFIDDLELRQCPPEHAR